jgi:hypothetical protein
MNRSKAESESANRASPRKNTLFREFSIGAFKREEESRQQAIHAQQLQGELLDSGKEDSSGEESAAPKISVFTRHQKRQKLLSTEAFGADPDTLLTDDPQAQLLLQMMGTNEPGAASAASHSAAQVVNPSSPKKAQLKRGRSFSRITDHSKFELEAQRGGFGFSRG